MKSNEIKDLLLKTQDWVQSNEIRKNCPYKEAVQTTSNHYDFLHKLVQEIQPKLIVELGTHLGVASLYIWEAMSNDSIFYTVDNNLIDSKFIATYTKGLDRVHFLLNDCKKAAKEIPNDIDLIFVDEEKEVIDLQSNLDIYYPKMKQGGIMLFDDVLGKDYYPEAYNWWTNLKGYDKIDLPLVHKGYAIGAIIK